MAKTIHDKRYRALIDRLINSRKEQRLSQEQVAARLERPQQFVSRYELGERRLDIIEYMDVASALALDGQKELADVLAQLKD